MHLATSRFGRTLLQFRRRALWISGLAACLGIVIACFLDPVTTREGAIILSISASVLASLVVAAIALERNEFADYLIGLGIDQVFKDRLQEIPPKLWTDLLAGVQHHFYVLGMANHGYLNNIGAKEETREALTKALRRKNVRVEFLWLDPTTTLAENREDEEGKRGLRRDACESIIFFWELAQNLEKKQRDRLSLREYTSLPTCGITWADNQLIVTHYLAAQLNLRAPGMVLDATEPVVRQATSRVRRREANPPALARAYISNYREVASDDWSREIEEGRLPTIRALHEKLSHTQPDKSSEAVLRHDGDKQDERDVEGDGQ